MSDDTKKGAAGAPGSPRDFDASEAGKVYMHATGAAGEPAAFGGYPTRAIGVMSDGSRVIFGGGGGNVSVGVSRGRPTFSPGDSLGVSSHSDAVAATSMGVSSTPDTHPKQPNP